MQNSVFHLKSAPILVLLAAGAAILGLAAPAEAATCTCDIEVWSDYRWMDPWWGLECDEHCGHGYVGSDCDTAHGEGCGAMTGFVRLRHPNGATIANRSCPDDHHTCFRGPSACDDGGAWGNACNADILHCVNGGYADGSFDCNALADSTWVYQLTAYGASFPGACGTNWFNVYEFIDENDPWCCDDPMGELNVSMYTAEGFNTTYLYPSAENCNGGSQGGVYPHCGKFGAQLTVFTSCSTTGAATAAATSLPLDARLSELGRQRPAEASRQAMIQSLERRERKLASTPREEVEVEVRERAAALGVKAPAARLTDLLHEAEAAAIARDRCQAEAEAATAAACRSFERRLARAEEAFERLAGGVTVGEFRSGSTLDGGPPPPAPPPERPSRP